MNNTIRGIENIVTKLWDENSVKGYRPIPFWSWNDRLEPEELKRQIKWMAQEGFGGYFMHARGGLETQYMGEEWFDNIRVGIEEGNRLGMHSSVYPAGRSPGNG